LDARGGHVERERSTRSRHLAGKFAVMHNASQAPPICVTLRRVRARADLESGATVWLPVFCTVHKVAFTVLVLGIGMIELLALII